MCIHHDKHRHGAYVKNLNKVIEGSEVRRLVDRKLDSRSGEAAGEHRTAVRNNGGGHINHGFFWTAIGPGRGGKPSGSLASAIDRELGGFDSFKSELTKAALGRFGSGWAWLVLGPDRKLLCFRRPIRTVRSPTGRLP